jgi:hypothetical protein
MKISFEVIDERLKKAFYDLADLIIPLIDFTSKTLSFVMTLVKFEINSSIEFSFFLVLYLLLLSRYMKVVNIRGIPLV